MQWPGGRKTNARLTLLSCFSLRNLHHVLSEDLHVCSWGEGATWGGWVMLDTLSNVKTWVNIIVWAFLKMFTFTKVWFDSKRKKTNVQKHYPDRRVERRATWQSRLRNISFAPFTVSHDVSPVLQHASIWNVTEWKVLNSNFIVLEAANNVLKWPETFKNNWAPQVYEGHSAWRDKRRASLFFFFFFILLKINIDW